MSTGTKGKKRINTLLEEPGRKRDGERNMEIEAPWRPTNVLKNGDRMMGIFQEGGSGSGVDFLLEFGKEDGPGCHNEDIVSGKDLELCSSCERLMVNCEDFKTDPVVETTTERKEVTKC